MFQMLLIVVVALLTVGCSHDRNTFYLSGATVEERALIQAAIDEWCEVGGLCATLTDDSSAASTITVVADMPAYPDSSGLHIPRHNGGDIWIARDLSNDVRVTALHELGHHFGCQAHLDSPTTVMYYSEGRTADHLTDSDLTCTD
jgi:hypothetical protein